MTTPEISGAEFRHVLGHFLTGVAVVTSVDAAGGEAVGMAVNSFTSVSLDPPLVLWCAAKGSITGGRILAATAFCVNILDESGEAISRAFASREPDRFAGIAWSAGPTGSPVLGEALAWVDCTVESEIDAGDHTVVIGHVRGLGAKDGGGGPLGFYRGGYGRFTV